MNLKRGFIWLFLLIFFGGCDENESSKVFLGLGNNTQLLYTTPSISSLHSIAGTLLAMDEFDVPLWESEMYLRSNNSKPSRFVPSPNGTLFYLTDEGTLKVTNN